MEMKPTVAPATRKQSARMMMRATTGRRTEIDRAVGHAAARGVVAVASRRASVFNDIRGHGILAESLPRNQPQYDCRRAVIGSTEAAFRAGIKQASTPIAQRINGTDKNVIGSSARMP